MRKLLVLAATMALVIATVGAATASSALLDAFTQNELDTDWEEDRKFPTGGVDSVDGFQGRDDVAEIGIVADKQSDSSFRQFEGIKNATENSGDVHGTAVQVDLYVPSGWQSMDINAGFWASDDPLSAFPIIAFRNSDSDRAGFYFWNGRNWARSGVDVDYDAWNTFKFELDDAADVVHYTINGQRAGKIAASGDRFDEVFLNHGNFGTNDYTAHWHNGATP